MNCRSRKTVTFLAIILLQLPAIVSAEQPQIKLGWTPNSESYLSHYAVYRDTVPGTMVYLDEVPKSDSTYTDVTVDPGITYYYKITALDSNGNESDPSNEVYSMYEQPINQVRLLSHTETDSLTLLCSDESQFDSYSGIATPDLLNTDYSAIFEYDHIKYTLLSLPDDTLKITLTLPEGAAPASFWNYGPTPGNSEPHWYEFLFDGTTGAEISGNIVTLHFKDGELGDHDLSTNGTLTTSGGAGDRFLDLNKDSIDDESQPHVADFSTFTGDARILVESPEGTSVINYSGSDIPPLDAYPNHVTEFQHAFSEFRVTGLSSGQTVEVSLTLPDNVADYSFWNYGPTPDSSAYHWYEFLFDGTTGAEISGNIVTLHFKDGDRGDHDLSTNGAIQFYGGPGNFGYDGNNDGIIDSQQTNYRLFSTLDGQHQFQVETEAGSVIKSAQAIQVPAENDSLVQYASFPLDAFEIAVDNFSENPPQVKLTLPDGFTFTEFYYYGSNDSGTHCWYKETVTAAAEVSLTYSDGGPADFDHAADGSLTIRGAFGFQDRNNDGIPDTEQSNLITTTSYDGLHDITFEAGSGHTIENLIPVEPPNTGASSQVSSFLYGAFNYTISGISGDGTSTVKMYFPEGTSHSGYWQYGPTSDNGEPHWYEFLYDGTAGAEINGNVVTIHYVDGETGDHDLTVDGSISIFGAPGSLHYDGNSDGIPDSEQQQVHSFPGFDGENMLTLQTSDGIIDSVTGVEAPEYENPDYVALFEDNFIDGTISNLSPAGTAEVTCYLPEGRQPESFWMFGPTQGHPEPHWYEFTFDGSTGAETDSNRVILHLKDGGPGDSDGIANGVITFSGGAGQIYFDGNRDDTPDAWQLNVETILAYSSQDSIMVVSQDGTSLQYLETGPIQSSDNVRYLPEFPHEAVEIEVAGFSAGSHQIVTLTYPVGTVISEFWMYGPTPGENSPHWFPFTYDGQTGAEINDNSVTLHFIDGQTGDCDLTANGTIQMQGGYGQFLYDGNMDAIADAVQPFVRSFSVPGTEDSITVASTDGTIIESARFINAPIPGDSSYSADFPLEFLDISISGTPVNSFQEVTIYLPAGTSVPSFWMYGPTPDNTTPHWYEFFYDGYTGAEIEENTVSLHLLDGKRGDHDLTANGELVLSGGPGELLHSGGDSTPIAEQKNMISFQSFDGNHYMTLVSPYGTEITDVQATDDPAALGKLPGGGLGKVSASDTDDYLSEIEFPYGFVQFSLKGAQNNEIVPVSLYLPDDARPESYFQYGVTPDNPIPHWYEFSYNGFTGAQMRGNVVTLNYVKDQRGDGDLDSDLLFAAGGPGYLLHDGNGDGIPDSQQDFVISFRPNDDTDYVTLSSNEQNRFINVRTSDISLFRPAPPAHLEFFYHLFEYNMTFTEGGGSSTMKIYLPENMSAESFYNYGPTPDNPEPHWYEFLYDGTTGAEIRGNVITLHFTDGARGDADLTADGILTAAGGPVFMIYDGNEDGTPDREQPHVSSFLALDGQTFLTLEAPDSTIIEEVSLMPLRTHEAFQGFVTLFDCIDFTITGLPENGEADVKLILPDTSSASRSFIREPSESGEIQWVEYFYAESGEDSQIENIVQFSIADGSPIDLDQSVNGSITVSTAPLQAGGPGTGNQLASENIYAYPNPFNPDLRQIFIRYSLQDRSNVTIRIFDAASRLVKTLTDAEEREGGTELSENWDGRNGAGDLVSNGVYYYIIETEKNRGVGKIAVIR
ncbi:MAG: hypothetical protein GF372_14315 [Candidatus Marinimicrobia bacterium]|nr:hypothetical protein [Candidatus Neomarinimicrobiota bacterium]